MCAYTLSESEALALVKVALISPFRINMVSASATFSILKRLHADISRGNMRRNVRLTHLCRRGLTLTWILSKLRSWRLIRLFQFTTVKKIFVLKSVKLWRKQIEFLVLVVHIQCWERNAMHFSLNFCKVLLVLIFSRINIFWATAHDAGRFNCRIILSSIKRFILNPVLANFTWILLRKVTDLQFANPYGSRRRSFFNLYRSPFLTLFTFYRLPCQENSFSLVRTHVGNGSPSISQIRLYLPWRINKFCVRKISSI